MKKIKNLILLAFLCIQGVYAQDCDYIQKRKCKFPNQGKQLSVSSKTFQSQTLKSTFYFNGVAQPTDLANYCVDYGASIQLKAALSKTSVTINTFLDEKVTSYEVIDLATEEIVTSGNGDVNELGFAFSPMANKRYQVKFNVSYRQRKVFSFENKTDVIYLFLCSGDFTSNVDIDMISNNGCESAVLGVTNANPNYTYYWTNKPGRPNVNWPSGTTYNITSSGTYYVYVFDNNTGTWSQPVEYLASIPGLVANPIPHTLYVCGCDLSGPFTFTAENPSGLGVLNWHYNGQTVQGSQFTLESLPTSEVSVSIVVDSCETESVIVPIEIVPCEECTGGFAPKPGKKYVVSAWVKEGDNINSLGYDAPYVKIVFQGTTQSVEFRTIGNVVEGWQKIEGNFVVPVGTGMLEIILGNESQDVDVYFDDVRIHPFYAGMVSYVYDLETMRLMAELGGDNYATFYVYDLEGNVIKTKQETKEGIITVGESRSSVKH